MMNTKDILFVIVLYRSDYCHCNTYRTLLSKVKECHIFVFDNSPSSQQFDDANVTYRHDASNPGLSYAYNAAAKFARENGYKWLLLTDQDTIFPNGMIDEYVKAINDNPKIGMFVPPVKISDNIYMSPVRMYWKTGRLSNNVPIGTVASLRKYSPINSGMCVSVDMFFKCGGYKDEVFLDYSDFQFVERYRKVSDCCFVLNRCVRQEFSVKVDNPDNTLKRFAMRCRSVRAMDRGTWLDSVGLFVDAFKRMLSLVVKMKSYKPIVVFINDYVKHESSESRCFHPGV